MKIEVIILTVIFTTFSNEASGQNCASKYDSATHRIVYVLTDKMPRFIGGLDSLMSTINRNLKWPGSCCLEGTVFVSFVVEADGKITNKKIKRGISNHERCNADGQALKVVDYLTDWSIGECAGEKVAVEIVVPIRYGLGLDR